MESNRVILPVDNNQQIIDQMTPDAKGSALHTAISIDDINMVKRLVENGANTASLDVLNDSLESTLEAAFKRFFILLKEKNKAKIKDNLAIIEFLLNAKAPQCDFNSLDFIHASKILIKNIFTYRIQDQRWSLEYDPDPKSSEWISITQVLNIVNTAKLSSEFQEKILTPFYHHLRIILDNKTFMNAAPFIPHPQNPWKEEIIKLTNMTDAQKNKLQEIVNFLPTQTEDQSLFVLQHLSLLFESLGQDDFEKRNDLLKCLIKIIPQINFSLLSLLDRSHFAFPLLTCLLLFFKSKQSANKTLYECTITILPHINFLSLSPAEIEKFVFPFETNTHDETCFNALCRIRAFHYMQTPAVNSICIIHSSNLAILNTYNTLLPTHPDLILQEFSKRETILFFSCLPDDLKKMSIQSYLWALKLQAPTPKPKTVLKLFQIQPAAIDPILNALQKILAKSDYRDIAKKIEGFRKNHDDIQEVKDVCNRLLDFISMMKPTHSLRPH